MKNKINLFFKETIMHNIGYKLLSLVIAVLVWLIIINIADPVTTRKFTGLEVNIINQSAITSVNQVYEVVSGNTVDFVVSGKASVVKNLKLSDFSAYADLSKLSPVYAADIVVQCTKGTAENIEIDSGNSVLIVKLEEIDTKNVQVVVETTGEIAEGYYVDDYEVKPNMLTVSGGVSKIKMLDSVKVIVNVDGAKKNFSRNVSPTPYDKDGNSIDPAYYTFTNSGEAVDKVKVTMTVYKTKSIPISVDIQGEPAAGYQYSGEYEYTPQSVVIGGGRKSLEKIDKLVVPVDITGASESNHEVNVNISEHLPDGVKAVGTEQVLSVRVSFDKIETKSLEFKASDVSINNIPTGYEAEIEEPDRRFTVYISGTSEEIAAISSSDIDAHVDLTGDTAGEYHIQVQFSDKVSKLLSSEAPTLEVTVTKKGAVTTEAPNDNTTEPEQTAAPTAAATALPKAPATETETPET